MKAMLLAMIKDYVYQILAEKVINRLYKYAQDSNNKVDDEMVKLVDDYIKSALK